MARLAYMSVSSPAGFWLCQQKLISWTYVWSVVTAMHCSAILEIFCLVALHMDYALLYLSILLKSKKLEFNLMICSILAKLAYISVSLPANF